MATTFNTLKKDATIFSELSKNPEWWKKFQNDHSLYIEIRKDNQINVYFEGGSVARIHYSPKYKKIQIFTHHKYLGIPSDKPMYVECSDFIENKLDFILNNVKQEYSQKHAINGVVPKEKWSEHYIQANLILKSKSIHLDSEFAYKDKESDIRIDMINVVDGAITFVELKRLDDSRMLKKTDNNPEVIEQMTNYNEFISKHKVELLDYYQKVFDIKKDLGLPVPDSRPLYVNTTPELLIFNRWEKKHPARDRHRTRMEGILKREKIAYKIIDTI